jgi:hypothetical protein
LQTHDNKTMHRSIRSGVFDFGHLTSACSVIAVDYEVLGLASDGRHCLMIFCLGLHFFGPCPRCRLRRRSLFAHLMWLTTTRCCSWHRRCLSVSGWLWPSLRSFWGDQRRLWLLGLPSNCLSSRSSSPFQSSLGWHSMSAFRRACERLCVHSSQPCERA